jgi:hypothetical protein
MTRWDLGGIYMDDQWLTIKLTCIDLPGVEFKGITGLRLGVQKGKEVIEDVPANVNTVSFLCPLRVEKNAKTGNPNFLGPYAQGTPEDRFIYLCWGDRRDELWAGCGRAKVLLKQLGWKTIEKAISTGSPIEAVIKMTDKKGGPLYATIRQENIEWRV